MYEHIPDTANTYIVITAEDLKDLRSTMLIGSAVGLVAAVGVAYWWERGEEDRKLNRRLKKEEKRRKERLRVEKLQAKVEAKAAKA